MFSANHLCRIRRFFLPVHLREVASFLGHSGTVAGDIEFQDGGVMDHPVNRRGGGRGVGEDALPLRYDQIGSDAQRSPFVAFGDEGEKDLGPFAIFEQISKAIEEREVEVVQRTQLPMQRQIALGGEEFLHQAAGWSEEDGVASFHQAVAHWPEMLASGYWNAGAVAYSPSTSRTFFTVAGEQPITRAICRKPPPPHRTCVGTARPVHRSAPEGGPPASRPRGLRRAPDRSARWPNPPGRLLEPASTGGRI